MWLLNKILLPFLFLIKLSSCSTFKYPEVFRNDSVVDNYFGTKVADPYRWLEDISSKETKNFIQVQNILTQGYLAKAASRTEIRKTLTKLWEYPKEELPMLRGGYYFLLKNSGLQNQWILYKGKTLEEVYSDEAEIFIDPNELSTDGTVTLSSLSFSKNEEILAYKLARSGSDWKEIRLKNISSGEDFPEVLNYTKFSAVDWTHDNLGFFYARYLEINEKEKLVQTNKNQKIFYHRVGTPQEKDTLVVQFLDKPDWGVYTQVSDDGEYLLVYTYTVINEDYLYYVNIKDAMKEGFQNELKLTSLTTEPASYSFIANDGHIFYFKTNGGAPNYRVIAMDINNPDRKHWATPIPEDKSHVLSWATPIAKTLLLVSYTKDVKSTLELRNLANGTLIHEYDLPAGSIQSTEGRRNDTTFYFSHASFSEPDLTYRLSFGKEIPRDLELYRKTAFTGLDTSKFETRQVFYSSKDGTKVPMFLVHRKDYIPKPDTPTLLYGYGGFQVSMEPFFSVEFLTFVSMFDGVLAVPNIRGGGEYGTKWWDSGRILNKQNSFDDFISAAEYLLRENITNPSKLTIQGGSNGGLLVGACVNQKPELFGAAIAEVGVMDMLRFQKFTVGSAWCGEYGCSDNQTQFENLIKYSPLHNIRNGTVYPAVFVTTGDTDDRVVPSHSFKYIAELQYTVGKNTNQTQPLLIRVEEKAGHGAGKPTSKQIDEYVDMYSFIQIALNLTFTVNVEP